MTREASNVWLLFAIGFALLAIRHFFVLSIYLNSPLSFLEGFERDLELVGVALIFAGMAVYHKAKRICTICYTKKADRKTVKDAKSFADGV